jgi:hypothetical protein
LLPYLPDVKSILAGGIQLSLGRYWLQCSCAPFAVSELTWTSDALLWSVERRMNVQVVSRLNIYSDWLHPNRGKVSDGRQKRCKAS